jgi:hypothetical protein
MHPSTPDIVSVDDFIYTLRSIRSAYMLESAKRQVIGVVILEGGRGVEGQWEARRRIPTFPSQLARWERSDGLAYRKGSATPLWKRLARRDSAS